jgi:hypothetical protein
MTVTDRIVDYSRVNTTVAYSEAAARGRLREWKKQLARDYKVFDRAYSARSALRPLFDDLVNRGSHKGRRRAFAKIAPALGSGPVLEGLRLDGDAPLALWSILKPRDSVTVGAPPETGLAQGCVTVNYVLAGVLPQWEGDQVTGVMAGITEGLWTLEVPDHALGRAMTRSGFLPDAIIREAHHNLLRLRASQLPPLPQFLVKAGPGGFVCELALGADQSAAFALSAHVRAATWISDDMVHPGQLLLLDDAMPGGRLQDWFLLPFPLRRFAADQKQCRVWRPGRLDLLAETKGRA